MGTAVVLAAVLIGLPGLAVALHLGTLALASLLYREPRGAEGEIRFLVLIPAHNEERGLPRTLAAIFGERRPVDQVLVVADRCTDGTAEVARSFGALVLERGADEEPGRAAARQAGLDYARDLAWDAVLMLDADSVIEPGFFAACQRALAGGAVAIQARSESGRGRSLAREAALAAFILQGITIPRGRDRLGVSVRLRGTGMAIVRELALAHRFRAPASEDLFFTLDLLLDGVRCRHVDSARLRSEGAGTWSSFGGQKVRYEAGRLAAARTYVPRLLRRAVRHRDHRAWKPHGSSPRRRLRWPCCRSPSARRLPRPGRHGRWPLCSPPASSRSRSRSRSGWSRRARACGPGFRCSSRRGTSHSRRSCNYGRLPACCVEIASTGRPPAPDLTPPAPRSRAIGQTRVRTQTIGLCASVPA